MKRNYIIIIILVIILFSTNIILVAAADPVTTGGSSYFANPLGDRATIYTIIQRIIKYLIMIGAPILAIMVIYGGYLILTAGDDPEKVKGGKNTILYAAIGYIIILSSYGVIFIINEVLGVKK